MILQPMSKEVDRSRRRAAFTLLEVLIVVAIIAILAGLGGVYAFRSYEDAKEGIARTKARSLAEACQQFQIKYDRYPESLQELLTPPDGNKPFVAPDSLVDPWNKPFQYNPAGPNNNGLKPDVFTTTEAGVQIGNWANSGSK